jgi:hypothetical protein
VKPINEWRIDMMGFGYRPYSSYNGYNTVGRKVSDKLIPKNDELPALRLKAQEHPQVNTVSLAPK